MKGIHQFVPMLHVGDAVGRHTLRLRDLMVARGIPSRIYVELSDPDTATETELAPAYLGHRERGDVLLYQFATASDLAPWLAARPETLVVNYHNVTPPELFAAWDNRLARHQVRARAELLDLAPRAALAVTVSAHNEAELVAAGYRRTAVVPPADMVAARRGPDPGVGAGTGELTDASRTPERGGTTWLSIGRLAPNKALEHAVAALALTRSRIDPTARLEIIGQPVVPAYTAALRRFIDELGLHQAVTFLGHVSDNELAAALARADLLVVTSQHEGFGVPLIEAMSVGLPVVANRAGALPEVLGEGGILVDTSDPWQLARAIADLLGDQARRAALVVAGQRQLAALDLPTAGDRLIDLIGALS